MSEDVPDAKASTKPTSVAPPADKKEPANAPVKKPAAPAPSEQKPAKTAAKKAETKEREARSKAGAAKADPPKDQSPKGASEHKARSKPELDEETRNLLGLRRAKKARQPAFRRQEWWRYGDLGGKGAPWRRPRGIHSKMRRHYKYRPPVVSIGYRGPAATRGLHPSGFEEVLVHRPADLEGVDPKKQAVRIGGRVGGRKAEAIEHAAEKGGIRVLNGRN